MKADILVIDDEKSMRDFLSIMLKKEGYNIETAEDGARGIEILTNNKFDLVITDVKMPNIDGMEVLKFIQENNPGFETAVIVITAFDTSEEAVMAMKLGAYDYITKPFKNERIKLTIKKVLEEKKIRSENLLLKKVETNRNRFENLVGYNHNIVEVLDLINQIADSRSTVLITGESGTGKELVARAIHNRSNRNSEPFMAVHCGALPPDLLESELFGHEKGAFTSAISGKQGLMEIADGGTFFLDEIGDAPLSVQVKLLRVLQDQRFKRVGGIKEIQVDIRLIAATNKNLEEEVKNKRFREDLYYRLNVIPIRLPALRERKDDIPFLVNHFLKKYSIRKESKTIIFSNNVIELLMEYDWPGNVRELENVVERSIVLSKEDVITNVTLPSDIISKNRGLIDSIPELTEDGFDLEKYINNLEKNILENSLKKTGGNITNAAKLLNLEVRSMRHRMSKYLIKGKGPNL
jgi:two-component system, NtrC family, response regulator PilR